MTIGVVLVPPAGGLLLPPPGAVLLPAPDEAPPELGVPDPEVLDGGGGGGGGFQICCLVPDDGHTVIVAPRGASVGA
jgi:hypothetical protein